MEAEVRHGLQVAGGVLIRTRARYTCPVAKVACTDRLIDEARRSVDHAPPSRWIWT